mmetsp:Transcript_6234/g.13789  ORF Transcript_6234/g.13789 Transcript_6234/m.13789 type:complete len:169 (+) Transcript_6234:31-537(+)
MFTPSTMRQIFAIALLALLAAPAVHAGCCNDKCKADYTTASTCQAGAPTREEAGCPVDEDKSDCTCGWTYTGPKTEANDCTNSGTTDNPSWSCSAAADYDTKGACGDPLEGLGEAIGGVMVGIGAALIGIIIAAVAVPVVIIILIVWCCCCRQQHTTVVVAQGAPQAQ